MPLDPAQFEWIEVNGGPDASYPIHHHYSILGYNRDIGTLDLLVWFDNAGGHCQAHRHVSPVSVFVIDGEHHVEEMRPGGERVVKTRTAGTHHLTPGDPYPHRERGGPDGGLVFFSHHSDDGRLYEIVDDDGNVISTVTVDSLVETWHNR